MDRIIAACGNDCAACPRFLPKKEEELKHTAELWMKIGYRDHVVSNGEISCEGCNAGNWCRYRIISCTKEHKVSNCGKCNEYPCKKIKECFQVTKSFIPACKRVCNDEEYFIMDKAFFRKEENLNE